MTTLDVSSPPEAAARLGVVATPTFFRRLLRKPLGLACVGYLSAVVLVGLLAPLVWPDVADQFAGDLGRASEGPSADHWLGTDTLGRDVLQRLLVGTRVSIIGVGQALVVFVAIGTLTGLVAGYYRGWPDRVAGWIADLAFSVPNVIVMLVVLTVFPQSMSAAMITFGLLAAPALMRVVRSATFAVRDEQYIDAARVCGLTDRRIIGRHVLPRVLGPTITFASLLAGVALMVQSGLAFLQLIVKAPAPSWGGMISDGARVIVANPWLVLPPGVMVTFTILALGLMGDVVRDVATEGWARPTGARASRAAPVVSNDAASAVDDALLRVKGLQVSFPSAGAIPVQVLDGVSFHISRAEIVGLVGESGCGKSTTARSILRALAPGGTIEAGSVDFAGRNLVDLSERDMHALRGRHIGLVAQEPTTSLDPMFRVGNQLQEAVRVHQGVSRTTARPRVLELLRSVGLPEPQRVARSYPHELSGGMAQRVGIARALAGEPSLLIADEPTTALDVTVQAEILALFHTLRAERGLAILFVTHDWGVLADLCDRAVVMYAGQVVESGPVVDLFRRPSHPYTAALLACDPHTASSTSTYGRRATGRARLPTIPGSVPAPEHVPTGCRFQDRCPVVTDDCRRSAIPLAIVGDNHDSRCIVTYPAHAMTVSSA